MTDPLYPSKTLFPSKSLYPSGEDGGTVPPDGGAPSVARGELLPAPSEWSPLEEQFHTWDIILVNPPAAGSPQVQSKVLSLWSNISITDTHEGIRTQIEVNAEEPAIPFIRELITDFVFYRDRQKLYRLRVVDSEDILTRDAATVRFDCVSYDKLLERRILHEDWLLDDGDINAAWRLIEYTQRRQTFGITRGTTLPGIRRQRALDAGDDILTAINDFAQADGGFDWWIDADLKFWAVKPRRGKRHNVQWQLGGEVGEMTRVNPIEDYSSLIMATGANSEVRIPRADGNEDVYPPPDPQVAQLVDKPLGLWEMTTSDTDVITTRSLMEKAQWHLGDKGTVRPTYKVMLEPGVWQPMFGIGDIVMLRIDTVRANVKVPIRIEELAITCTADGAEVISMSVRAEEPETPISAIGGKGLAPLPMLLAGGDAPEPNGRTVQRHRLSEADDLGALLRSMRKRLDRAERSRGMGGGSGLGILDGYGPPPASIGSPGDYYVDTTGQELYGPKADGTLGPSAVEATTYTDHDTGLPDPPSNTVLLNQEVGIGGYAYKAFDIVGFRYRGNASASPTLNVSFWDRLRNTLIYRTTTPGTGSGGWVEIPPIAVTPERSQGLADWGVSLGGASIPVRGSPSAFRGDYGAPAYVGMYFGVLTGPLGQSMPFGNQSGAHSLDLQLLVRLSEGVVVGPEELGVNDGWPNDHFNGELMMDVFFSEPGRLLGWRYRRLETTPSPLRFRVWDVVSQVKPGTATPLIDITVDHTGEGEFEVRLPTPIYTDGFLLNNRMGISIGSTGVPYAASPNYNAGTATGWWSFTNAASQDDVIGDLPIYMPGYPNYKRLYIMPIVQQDAVVWPLTNMARSGGLDNQSTRVELHRNIERPYSSSDYHGLGFYEGGPSHDQRWWTIDEGVPWWSVRMAYDGNSGIGLEFDDWWDTEGPFDAPGGQRYSNKYAYIYWYYDYFWFEQDCDLDERHPTTPGSFYMAFNETSTWDWYSYQDINCYGPYHGAAVMDPETGDYSQRVSDNGGAGFFCEVAELNDDTMSCISRIFAIADDGIMGTQLQVTPRVIQACFPPDGDGDTWWGGDSPAMGLTPKGCVSPLITAAAATATAADEPWQKQFFRQIGTNLVTFNEGIGTIGVPTAMATPAVVHAQVDGVTVGGHRISQAQRTNEYTLTVALDTAHNGAVSINWTVEHAALTFGTPPPSIDSISRYDGQWYERNEVPYSEFGGSWTFELVSYGDTFVNGCILRDFTGAVVGGPFTIETVYPIPEYDPNYHYQRIVWSAGRDWYLPGESQQYRLTNPDGQVSAWNIIFWVEDVLLRQAKVQQRGVTAANGGGGTAEGEVDPNRYSNNPKLHPIASQLPFSARATATSTPSGGKPRGGKERRQAMKDRAAQLRSEKEQAVQPSDTPTDE